MMNSSSSPVRLNPKNSILAQRLHEAEKLDNHLSEIEDARKVLEEAKQKKNFPPPPPPPSSPRSRALNRVLELSLRSFQENLEVTEAHTAYNTLKEVVENVLHEHVRYDNSEQENGDHRLRHQNSLTLIHHNNVNQGEYRRRLNFEDVAIRNKANHVEDQLIVNSTPRPKLTGRFWRAAITSATTRHGRVEYEIRSELTSISEKTLEATTGTSVVRRRYRDFDRLHKAILRNLRPNEYVLIPSLPPKDIASILSGSRADPDFVWDRRVGLQLWLRYVCTHNVIRNSTLLREFLWEPSSSAVSNDTRKFEDMNVTAESALWKSSLSLQEMLMGYRFGNSVVALTSMGTHIKGLIHSYKKSSLKAIEVVKWDGSLARSLNRASKVFSAWADFERSAGQNYSFVAKFASALQPKDVNRQTSSTTTTPATHHHVKKESNDEDALVSFSEKDLQLVPRKSADVSLSTSKGHVEAPVSIGASCDVRSLKAFQTLLNMWGNEILPSLDSKFVDPKETSSLPNSQNNNKQITGIRVACEWTEVETLKRDMIRDGALRLIEEQILHAQEESERWMALEESIRAHEVEISSLVALGDVITPPSNPSTQQQQHHHHHHHQQSFSPTSTNSSPQSIEERIRQPSTTPPKPALFAVLDKNLDEVQARFQQEEEEIDTSANHINDSRHLNPFFSDDDE